LFEKIFGDTKFKKILKVASLFFWSFSLLSC